MTYARSLNDALKSLGMEAAFDPARADFSRIHPPPPELFIGDVEHKTYVKVDEEGTEAAAATSVGMVGMNIAVPQAPPFEMIVDHPFFCAIAERQSGVLLFAGMVTNPTGPETVAIDPANRYPSRGFLAKKRRSWFCSKQYWLRRLSHERGDSMQLMFFTERGYYPIPENEVLKQRSFFGLSNKYFDPTQGARLLNEYIDDKIYCEELGFDGVALNEHHGTPYCLGAVMDVEAAVLARATKRVKIVLIGNPLPVISNPLRLAEEVAMIDLISGGRLVPGIIRGTGCEQIFNNANPALNREYFDEAHDLMIKAWTVPGSVSLRRQALQLPLRKSVGAAAAKAASANLAARRDQSRDRDLGRAPSLYLRGAVDQARADPRPVEPLRQDGRRRGLSGRPRKLRLYAAGLLRRNRGAGRGLRPALPVRRRLCVLRAQRMDVPAGIQLQGRHAADGGAGQSENQYLGRGGRFRRRERSQSR